MRTIAQGGPLAGQSPRHHQTPRQLWTATDPIAAIGRAVLDDEAVKRLSKRMMGIFRLTLLNSWRSPLLLSLAVERKFVSAAAGGPANGLAGDEHPPSL